MPQRQNKFKLDCTAVQGAGAWAEMTRPTWGDVRELSQTDNQQAQLAVMGQIVAKHVLSWNWVSDTGEVLPAPASDATVIDLLTDQEMKFLCDALVTGNTEQRKN